MAMSRNERRLLGKLRLEAKAFRVAKAELGRQKDERKSLAKANTYVKDDRRHAVEGKLVLVQTSRLPKLVKFKGLPTRGKFTVLSKPSGSTVTVNYPPSCMANMLSQSHRPYVCQGAGTMSRRSAMALKAKGSWRG